MDRNPLNIIATISSSFSKVEGKIAEFVIDNYELIPSMTIKELAEQVQVAESSIIRFTQKLGYDGYSDFKLSCATARAVTDNKSSHFNDILSDEQIKSKDFTFENVLKLYQYHTSNTIEANIKGLDYATLNTIAQLILEKDHLFFCGEAESGSIALNAYSKFKSLFRNSHCSTTRFTMVQDSYMLEENDLVIAVSQSGTTAPVVDLCKAAKEKGCTVVCFTATVNSPLYNTADHRIIPISLFTDVGSRYFINQTIFKLIFDSLYIYVQAALGIEDQNTKIPLFDHNWFK